jgi:Lon protease-like protein
MSDLIVPLFPLNGVIFFPNSSLPLNIFEQRYIEMIDFSLSSNRMIGIIQSKEDKSLYNLGCVGKINSFDETDDGRYIVNLVGKNYFLIANEIKSENKFRLAKIEEKKIDEYQNNIDLKKLNRDLLLKSYEEYIEKLNIKIDINLINQIENIDLIRFIAMSCPFSSADKQMLLETFDLMKLSEKLIGLLNFYSKNISEKNTIN